MSLSGRGGVMVGTIWADVQVQGQAQAQKGLQDLNKTAKETQGGLGDLAKTVLQLAASYLTVQTAVRAFNDLAQDTTSINRVVVAMTNLHLSTAGVRESMEKASFEFMRWGQTRDAAFRGYQQLVQATGNATRAQDLLTTSLRFATVQGEDVQTVVNSLTKAYEGQPMLLNRMLELHGYNAKAAKDFAESLELVKAGGEHAEQALSDEAKAIYGMKTALHELTEELVKQFAPAVVGAINSMSTFLDRPEVKFIITHLGDIRGMLMSSSGQVDVSTYREQQNYWARRRRSGYSDAGGYEPGTGGGSSGAGGYAPSWANTPMFDFRNWPAGAGGSGGKQPAPYGTPGEAPKDYGSLFGWTLGEGYKRPESEADTFTPEDWKKMSEEFKRELKDRQDAWDESHKEMFDVARQFSDGVGNSFDMLLTNGKDSFKALADYWKSMLLRMASDLIASQVMNWLGGAIRSGSFGGGARPTSGYMGPDTGGGATIGGFGPRPLPSFLGGGGAVVINISPMDLAQAFNGSPVRIKRSLSTAMLSHGLETAASLT